MADFGWLPNFSPKTTYMTKSINYKHMTTIFITDHLPYLGDSGRGPIQRRRCLALTLKHEDKQTISYGFAHLGTHSFLGAQWMGPFEGGLGVNKPTNQFLARLWGLSCKEGEEGGGEYLRVALI